MKYMKDYRINKKEHQDDILEVRPSQPSIDEKGQKVKTDSVDVYFADGKVFRDVKKTPRELRKINERQEAQVDTGIENLAKFRERVAKSKIGLGASVATGTLSSIILATSPMVTPIFNIEPNPVTITVAGVTIALCGAIPAGIGLVKNLPIVEELEKLKYRNEHRKELDSIGVYPNALAGLSNDQARRIRRCMSAEDEPKDPFSVAEVDQFSQQDLETIVDNIQREKTYEFEYVKRPTRQKTSSSEEKK